MYEYFYGRLSDPVPLVGVPKVLFESEKVRGMSSNAKLLYSLMLARMTSPDDEFEIDDDGKAFIIFKQSDISDAIGYSKETVMRLLSELEAYGLVERLRRRHGEANRIYLKNCFQ